MRVIANLANNDIIGTDSEPILGGETVLNGQYAVTYPMGVSVEVGTSSYLTPQNANSVGGQAAAEFLIRYPMYDHVLYTFFCKIPICRELPRWVGLRYGSLRPSPALVTTSFGNFAPSPLGPRCQIGRAVGPAPVGIAPGSVAILPAATAQTTPATGV